MLLACAVLFVVITKLDRAAADHAFERARAAAAVHAPAPVKKAPTPRPAASGVAVAGGFVTETPAER